MTQTASPMKFIKRIFNLFLITAFLSIPITILRQENVGDLVLFMLGIFMFVAIAAYFVFSVVPAYLEYKKDKEEDNDSKQLFP